jgi:D-threonate/D-erythronate kinase
MTELVVIADDLTGAADCAAPFVPLRSASVLLDAATEWPGTDIVSVDTDSRYADPLTAAERVKAVVGQAQALDALVFKKIDSTMRGNVATEVAAALNGLTSPSHGLRPLAIVAPAFPARGRTTRGGRVELSGQALDRPGADLMKLFTSSGQRVSLVPISTVRNSSDLSVIIREMRSSGPEVLVVDAETDSDLARIAVSIAELKMPALVVGSGGLASALAMQHLPMTADRRASDACQLPPPAAPMLFVIGSYSAEARAQGSMLAEAGARAVELRIGDDLAKVAEHVRSALRMHNVVLSVRPGRPTSFSHANSVASMLAAVTVAVLDSVGTVVATGGETARAILLAHGTSVLTVCGEFEAGVVALRSTHDDLDLVVKAGSFGDPTTLCRLICT